MPEQKEGDLDSQNRAEQSRIRVHACKIKYNEQSMNETVSGLFSVQIAFSAREAFLNK
jgi:hypothetical protein